MLKFLYYKNEIYHLNCLSYYVIFIALYFLLLLPDKIYTDLPFKLLL